MDESALLAAEPRAKPYKIFPGARGIYLQIQPNGGKYWRYRIRRNGINTTLSLGTFPETPISAALIERDRLLAQARAGLNPSDERRAIREAAKPPAFAVALSERGALSITIDGRPLHLSPAQTEAVRAVLLTEVEGDAPCP
ncbi:MAG: Arm DNA-binding domain-containing protein [Luteimonas sp.]|nr:Arm DNA-binding domain-containing protein [Luteimonas sp.]